MKICVLQPDYSPTEVDYKYYDPPRDLTALLPGDEVNHVFLNKLTTYKQLKELKRKKYDCFVNLCEGYPEWEVPNIDVVYWLEQLNVPFTGPNMTIFDPPKEVMKYVAFSEGILTPAYVIIESANNLAKQVGGLKFPMFVKPAKAGDSLGVDDNSLVQDEAELKQKAEALLLEYEQVIVEEYISGRELTVLVAASADDSNEPITFKPIEFIFPEGRQFKTYALKTSELHPDANIPCDDPALEQQLRDAARRIFRSFGGVGYARMDFRLNDKNELYFLEVNFTCSVFYKDGYEGSADYILKHDGIGQAGFLKHIIAEGIARHRRRQKKFVMKANSISGFGIYAKHPIPKGELVFHGEEKSQRLVTKTWVDKNWKEEEKDLFRRYAYPISNEVYVLWDSDPCEWAPQNHSCDPNTAIIGMNVYATRDIEQGEELTLDYAVLLNEETESFQCHCGAANCRGVVMGTRGNSITHREALGRTKKLLKRKSKAR